MKKMALQGRTREEAAEDFAASLFQKWGVGEASCGNGAILLLSLEDRQVTFVPASPEAEISCVPACNQDCLDRARQLNVWLQGHSL